MPICYGNVISKKLPDSTAQEEYQTDTVCCICYETIVGKPLQCLKKDCKAVSHIICLSQHFLDKGEYIPIEGKCPKCEEVFLWGDLVRKYKGCYGNLDLTVNCNDLSDVDSD